MDIEKALGTENTARRRATISAKPLGHVGAFREMLAFSFLDFLVEHEKADTERVDAQAPIEQQLNCALGSLIMAMLTPAVHSLNVVPRRHALQIGVAAAVSPMLSIQPASAKSKFKSD